MPGFEFLRMLQDDERLILNRALEICKSQFPTKPEAIYWYSIYAHGKFGTNHDFSFMKEWVQSMVREATGQDKVVIGYGFTINPKGNTKGQPFHIDYTATDSTIYIPMTKLTTQNSPQYLSISLNNISLERAIDPKGLTDEEIMMDENLNQIEVKQLISRPFAAYYMHPSTIHRGVPNTSDYDRILFWIEIDDYEHEEVEATAHEYSTQTYKPAK